MKVLWLSRETPLPANSGDRNYTRHLVRALADAGADIDFVSLWSEERDIGQYQREGDGIVWLPVEGSKEPSFKALFTSLPLATARHRTRAFQIAVRKAIEASRYDAIMLDHYALGWVLDVLGPGTAASDTVIVHICHDFTTAVSTSIAKAYKGNLIKKLLLNLNSRKIARMERRFAESADLITVITQEDGRAFAKLLPKRAPLVLRPGYDGDVKTERTIDGDTPRRVVILGSFNWIAKRMNLEAFLSVADERFASHGIRLDIIGLVPDDLRNSWASRLKATEFLGFVDDISDEFERARFGLVVEETGGGFKLKLLDYIFGRVPVATLANATSGMDEGILEGFLVRDDLVSLTEAICSAIDDLPLLNRLQDTAFAAATGKYDWQENGMQLRRAISDCSAGRKAL